ncbi:MAG: Abi family protein [Pseudomonadota bacterium]
MEFGDRFAPYYQHVTPYIKDLANSGLHVSSNKLSRHSRSKAAHYISKVGMQRFHAYYVDLKPIIEAEDANQVGIDDVLRLYKLDRKLRLLSLDAIERIEVAVKVEICSFLEEEFGRHFLSEILSGSFDGFNLAPRQNEEGDIPSKIITKAAKDIAINARKSPELKFLVVRSQEEKDAHLDPSKQVTPPIAFNKLTPTEICALLDKRHIADAMTLGVASRIYERLGARGQARVSSNFKVPHDVFEGWLRRMTTVRNSAAHHSRLWNRTHSNDVRITKQIYPNLYKSEQGNSPARKFYSTSIVLYHCLKCVARRTRWHWRLFSTLDSKSLTPECLNVCHVMGFPKNWDRHDFWKGVGSTD